ncbi:hypothetical protein [Brachybacterium kimchii]|uniref:Uncharacterized protein n=1 Tax=Brachybacterium kimchii TaxID=2942909 RepID=A0ABY4NAU7_9MICO|nr:hypothetical protein [Brachybacterium kimchii]UQN30500.1 hypothetical protein M4486_03920 [Brachybacterium kimchii]
MTRAWLGDLSDFRWRADDGTEHGTTPGAHVPEDAPTTWIDLLDHAESLHDGLETYSTLLALFETGGGIQPLPWQHRHRAIEPPTKIDPREVPQCHGWPMRLAPGAWICRVDGEVTRPDRVQP